MNFYFSLYQLIETVERLNHDIQHLAGRALRISPRDARANRELLEQCETKLGEVKHLLNNKTHISKITLRKAALLFQILEVSHRRVMNLAAATSAVGLEDDQSVKALWQLLAMGQRHYQTLVKTLNDMTGIPNSLVLQPETGAPLADFAAALKKEWALQQETLKQLERAIEVFGEEQELAETLSAIRKELLEAKKRLKHLSPALAHAPEKQEAVPAPAAVKN
ncbi:MAG TPA: hypothetical protein VFR02_03055 [bacterium]|nr:hypothetical protein [bacterium]